MARYYVIGNIGSQRYLGGIADSMKDADAMRHEMIADGFFPALIWQSVPDADVRPARGSAR